MLTSLSAAAARPGQDPSSTAGVHASVRHGICKKMTTRQRQRASIHQAPG